MIITLIGSVSHKNIIRSLEKRLSLLGDTVLTPVIFNPDERGTISLSDKEKLHESFKRKIDVADKIYVIRVDKGVGKDSRRDIEYAESKSKKVCYRDYDLSYEI